MQLTVKDTKTESKDSLSLILEKPENFSFYPGQFLDIGSPRKAGSLSQSKDIS